MQCSLDAWPLFLLPTTILHIWMLWTDCKQSHCLSALLPQVLIQMVRYLGCSYPWSPDSGWHIFCNNFKFSTVPFIILWWSVLMKNKQNNFEEECLPILCLKKIFWLQAYQAKLHVVITVRLSWAVYSNEAIHD